jgi:hypothetical protein
MFGRNATFTTLREEAREIDGFEAAVGVLRSIFGGMLMFHSRLPTDRQ